MTPLPLSVFKTAQQNLTGRIRRTPQMDIVLDSGQTVTAKLENLQISGSFKIRGALNTVLSLQPEALAKGLVTASGGNHGLGVATAGSMTGASTTIYLPRNTPASKIAKLEKIATKVIVVGDVWDDANNLALEDARKTGKTYVHPFADESVIAGQGTLGLEILHDNPEIDVLLVAIGGGGLISGIASAAKLIKPNIKVIGVEAVGAPTLKNSLDAGKLVALDKIETKANTLAPRQSAQINFDIISEYVDQIALVTDEDMQASAEWLWQNCGLGLELSAAATIAALRAGVFSPRENEKVCAIICGSGPDGY
ncbi:pyridoxal-phosphate dependent enzyme [Sneathiella marina]|uniref:Pyridoxal-phosphate dependent enzyme n=1 Tax=Sneathiella marina TaxID=2950108 RepID=A0ABY4W7S9_9PROT|nr:pyridoxal-phosphate dependent enzyme [Sneathiella marina]USG61810.1 pyridoxal-phosphate dependent enzyme [Sneathiella marina]